MKNIVIFLLLAILVFSGCYSKTIVLLKAESVDDKTVVKGWGDIKLVIIKKDGSIEEVADPSMATHIEEEDGKLVKISYPTDRCYYRRAYRGYYRDSFYPR